MNQFGILPFKLIFGNNYIDKWRGDGCVLMSNNRNNANWCDYVGDEV